MTPKFVPPFIIKSFPFVTFIILLCAKRASKAAFQAIEAKQTKYPPAQPLPRGGFA